jgi:hypothetical protein
MNFGTRRNKNRIKQMKEEIKNRINKLQEQKHKSSPFIFFSPNLWTLPAILNLKILRSFFALDLHNYNH